MKSKIAKNNKKQVKPSEKQKYKIKVSETLENEGVDYEEELSKNKRLEIELRKDEELACVEYYELNRKSVCLEKRHDALVEQFFACEKKGIRTTCEVMVKWVLTVHAVFEDKNKTELMFIPFASTISR